MQVPWALVGAMACSVHTEPRTTKDIDVAIALSEKHEIGYLLEKFTQLGYSKYQILMHTTPVRSIKPNYRKKLQQK